MAVCTESPLASSGGRKRVVDVGTVFGHTGRGHTAQAQHCGRVTPSSSPNTDKHAQAKLPLMQQQGQLGLKQIVYFGLATMLQKAVARSLSLPK